MMNYTLIGIGATGAIIGWTSGAAAIVWASSILFVGGMILGRSIGWSIADTVLTTFAHLFVMQVAFLAALGVRRLRNRD